MQLMPRHLPHHHQLLRRTSGCWACVRAFLSCLPTPLDLKPSNVSARCSGSLSQLQAKNKFA